MTEPDQASASHEFETTLAQVWFDISALVGRKWSVAFFRDDNLHFMLICYAFKKSFAEKKRTRWNEKFENFYNLSPILNKAQESTEVEHNALIFLGWQIIYIFLIKECVESIKSFELFIRQYLTLISVPNLHFKAYQRERLKWSFARVAKFCDAFQVRCQDPSKGKRRRKSQWAYTDTKKSQWASRLKRTDR